MDDSNWGWAAGAGFIAFAWVIYLLVFSTKGKVDWAMTRLWEGADGRASFSKFQFWLWTSATVLAVFSIWVARMIVAKDIVSPIDEVPEHLLAILGISTGTAVGAKGITTLYVNGGLTGKLVKGEKEPDKPFQELLADDSGVPELAKYQMFLFTLIAVILFLITVADNINSGKEANMVLPDVDESLMILMGISASGYIGKKFVTRESPKLSSILPTQVQAGKPTHVTLTGRALGDKDIGILAVGPKVYKTPAEKANMEWTGSAISFDFDGDLPADQDYHVEVIVGDAKSDPQTLRVVKA